MGGGFVMTRMDLRPYYIEVLDRKRFKNAEKTDRGEAIRFLRFASPNAPK